MKMYKIDELNNMSITELKELEDETWRYFKKIENVRKFQEAVEREE